MARYKPLWDYDPGGNVDHLARHDLTPQDIDAVFRRPKKYGVSRSSGRPTVSGYMPGGRYVCVPFDRLGGRDVYPVTAFDA